MPQQVAVGHSKRVGSGSVLHISAVDRHISLHGDMENRFASVDVEEAARLTHRTMAAVRFRRQAWGDWSPDQDKLLGTQSDAEIAALLGRSRSAVMLRRRILKIPRAKKD